MSNYYYQPPVNIHIPADATVEDHASAPVASLQTEAASTSRYAATASEPNAGALIEGPMWPASVALAPVDAATAGYANLIGQGHGHVHSPFPTTGSSTAIDGDDGLYGPASAVDASGVGAATPLAASPLPTDVTRRYVNSVVSSIAVNMSAFDGTTNALRLCPGAKVEAQKDLSLPDDAEEFSMAWFGIARAIFTVIIAQETPEKVALRDGVSSDGAAPLTLSVKETRRAFASGLNSIIADVLGSGGSPSFRRYSLNRPLYMDEVSAVSKRMMEEWLAQGVLPEQLQDKYDALKSSASTTAAESGEPTTGDVMVQSVQDLELILSADADMWVASFFPLHQFLRRDGVGKIRPIWADEATLRLLNKEELAYQIYALCTLKCLLQDKSGRTRGVAVPRAWLQRLLGWVVAVNSCEADMNTADVGSTAAPETTNAAPTAPLVGGGDDPSNGASHRQESPESATPKNEEHEKLLSTCPGPIDTFHCIHVAPGSPARHWLLPQDRDNVDVIPERLFDYLCLLFGSGPRYLTYGDFTLQSSFEAFLKPLPLMVEVTFAWEKQTADARAEESATVYVEEAVRRSDLAEVFRLAMQLACEESGFMPPDKLAMFSAAVCGPSALVINVKDVNTESLKPYMRITEEDVREITVSDILARGTQLLKKRTGSAGAASSASLRKRKKEELSFELRLRTPDAAGGEEESRRYGGGTPKGSKAGKVVVTANTVARRGVCGLTNIGNTCYMNSALQCLSALRPFREDLLAFPVSKYPTASITSAYVRLLSDMWSGQYDYANTRELKDAIGEKERRFAGYQQQDANELIEVLLDRMEEEVNQVSGRRYRERLDSDKDIPLPQLSQIFWDNFLENNTGFIPRDFFHQSKTVFRCLTCGETSTVFDNNLTLSLTIKEPKVKKAMRVVALVYTPQSDSAQQGNEEGGGTGERISPLAGIVHVHLSVRVVTDANGAVAEDDLKAAVRQNLVGNANLRAMVLSSPPAKDAGEEGDAGSKKFCREIDDVDSEPASTLGAQGREAEDVQLDYAVGLLEVPEQGTTYAFANCFVKRTSSSTSTGPRKAPQATVGEGAGSDAMPEYRVWYYLKDSHYGAPTSYGSLAYVEDLPVVDDGDNPGFLSTHTDLADSVGTASEEGGEPRKSPEASSAPPSRVMSKHIIARGRTLAAELLRPVSDDAYGQNGGALPYATDYMMLPYSAPKPPKVDTPQRLVLKVMHRRNRLTPLLDITQSSNKDGDTWLHHCRQETAGNGNAEGEYLLNHQPDEKAVVKGIDAANEERRRQRPVTNVVIFLQYDGDQFDKVEVPTATEPSASKYGWGGGFASKLLDEEDDQSCTLDDCLRRAMETDKLTGNDSWYCPQCKEFRETCVQRGLFRLPPCLVISFKRFKMANSYHADKNNTTVTFPTHVDFATYLDKDARAAPGLNPRTHYKLRGVVYHSGSLSFGHYTASVYNDALEKWVYCNDTSTSMEHGATPAPNGAYILCYEQVTPPQEDEKPLS